MSHKSYQTDHLFPRPSILIGMGSTFNLPGNYYEFNTSASPEEADSKAIESDWGVIAQDIEEVFKSKSICQSLENVKDNSNVDLVPAE